MSEKELSNGNAVKVGEGDQAPAPEMPVEAPPPPAEEIVTPEVLDKIVKGYNEDCEWVDFKAELGTKVGDNYMSIMYAVEIELKNRKSGENETLHIMLKTMPRNAMRQQMINESGAFIKDAKMYQEVFPAMVEFQKERGLKDEEIFQVWPKCYTTFHDGKHDYLAMENLRIEGYKMANRQAGLDMEHATLTLQSIAKFHAISYAMFLGDYDKLMETYPWLEEKMFMPEEKIQEPMRLWLKATMDNESDMLRKAGFEEAANLVGKVYDENFWTRLNKLCGSKVANAVIDHGDCWTNNFLFNYGSSGALKSLKFVDFQISRCSSRCIDLGYFIHTSLPLDILNNKEMEILRIYFDAFTDFAGKLGEDSVARGLTWESFQEEYKENRFYGVVMGLMLAPMLCADSSAVPDMEEIKEEDFNGDAAKDFMNALMGDLSTKKICNLALKHLSRVEGFGN